MGDSYKPGFLLDCNKGLFVSLVHMSSTCLKELYGMYKINATNAMQQSHAKLETCLLICFVIINTVTQSMNISAFIWQFRYIKNSTY